MVFDAPGWLKQRGPLFWNQLLLVALAAIGYLDFFRQMLFYAVECEIATLIGVFCYSRTVGIAFSKLVEWLVATFMFSFCMLIIWAVTHESPKPGTHQLLDLFNMLPLTIGFWFLQFGAAWRAARRNADPKYAFFAGALYPSSLPALLFTAFILFWIFLFASSFFHFQIDGTSSIGMQRLIAIILVALGGILRVAFAYVWANPDDTAKEYRSFQQDPHTEKSDS